MRGIGMEKDEQYLRSQGRRWLGLRVSAELKPLHNRKERPNSALAEQISFHQCCRLLGSYAWRPP